MNQNTLWLQVPAAKVPSINRAGLPSVPDKLDYIAIKLASLQGYESPYLDKINIILFIADHGITSQDISSLTQPIIAEILKTKLEIVNIGTNNNLESIAGVIHSPIATSTEDFFHTPAMSNEQLAKAINIGRQSAQRIHLGGAQLFVASAINNANILSAHALSCALLNIEPEQLSSLNNDQRKLIQQALAQHKKQLTSPLEILRYLGSFEIAALTGSYLCCAHMGMPVLIDGFTSAVAALITERLCPEAKQWFLYSQISNNPAHKQILKTLRAQPLLQLDQTLDDISGIASTLSLLYLACASHNEKIIFSNEILLKKYS